MAISQITANSIADGTVVASDIADGAITDAKIVGVANTKITGLVTASQIATVANTQITGSIEATQVGTTVSQLFGMRNRIINGDMRIDQINAGASVTVNNNVQFYTIDRWQGVGQATDGVFTLQQSTVAPAGFQNSLLATVTTADTSLGATQGYHISQPVEGFNSADFAWGTANAQTVTLSFWVRSSLTGTFGGSLRNGDGTRSYPFSYNISAANTWEYKTVTAAGDTTGTWGTGNGRGVMVFFSLGNGTDRLGTAGAWNANNNQGATGQVNPIATNGATFYITGVQLEQNTSATPFERRLYNQELANCQRYARTVKDQDSTGGGASSPTVVTRFPFPVPMRATPSVILSTAGSFILGNDFNANYTASTASISSVDLTPNGGRVVVGGFAGLPAAGTFLAGTNATGTSVVLLIAEL